MTSENYIDFLSMQSKNYGHSKVGHLKITQTLKYAI